MKTDFEPLLKEQFGLDALTVVELIHVFEKSKNVDAAILFGSRAIGNFKSGSDIDLALAGENLSFGDEVDLRIAVDQLDLIWKVDFVRLNTLTDSDLLQHIKRVGKTIYQRGE